MVEPSSIEYDGCVEVAVTVVASEEAVVLIKPLSVVYG